MKMGFTGSSSHVTKEQKEWLRGEMYLFAKVIDEVHHGGCIEADEFFHDLAIQYGITVIVHPPLNEKKVMDKSKWDHPNVIVLPPKYSERQSEKCVLIKLSFSLVSYIIDM